MILKQDKNLAIIANRTGKAAPDVAYILTNGLLNAGLIKDDEEYYGVALKDCVDGSTPVSTIVDIIKQTGIDKVNYSEYDAFVECIVMGDGDCPECGGLMIQDGEGYCLHEGDDITPPSIGFDRIIYTCPLCGHIVE